MSALRLALVDALLLVAWCAMRVADWALVASRRSLRELRKETGP